MSMPTYPRISGRLGNTLDLNVTFYRNGVPADPFAIRRVKIYRSAVQPENLVAEFVIPSPLNPDYPSPIQRELDTSNVPRPGVYHLYWDVPSDLIVPDIYFDVWEYLPDDPGVLPGVTETGGTIGDITGGPTLDDESLWMACCNQFWLYADGVNCDDGLEDCRFGFEAIDEKFFSPEIRTLQVGIMPLPLYDYNYNKCAPMIPMLRGRISIFTDNCETLVDNVPMTMGIRSGTYRSNPFVLKYRVDTSQFLKGSYKYQVTLELPNGETRVSPKFVLQVA
jgi:hypothetical protein